MLYKRQLSNGNLIELIAAATGWMQFVKNSKRPWQLSCLNISRTNREERLHYTRDNGMWHYVRSSCHCQTKDLFITLFKIYYTISGFFLRFCLYQPLSGPLSLLPSSFFPFHLHISHFFHSFLHKINHALGTIYLHLSIEWTMK